MEVETQACPRCGRDCSRNKVHNGIAMLYGPWGCSCGWSEDPRYDQAEIEQPKTGHLDQWGGFTPDPTSNACLSCCGEGIIECVACRGFGDADGGSPDCDRCHGKGHQWCAACGGKGVRDGEA